MFFGKCIGKGNIKAFYGALFMIFVNFGLFAVMIFFDAASRA
jgi:hypothetical protein